MSAAAVTQRRVVRSEWTKLVTLRSTRITLLLAVGFFLLLSLLLSTASVHNFQPGERADFDPVSHSLAGGMYMASLAFGVLGVLFISGEYATGMIQASFAAVPKRLPVLWGKWLVFFAVTIVLGGISCLVAFEIGQAVLSSKHLDVTLGDPGVVRAVLGAALFATAVGILGLAFGTIMRSTAGAIATLVGIVFILPEVVTLLPHDASHAIGKFLPTNAGLSMVELHHDPAQLPPLAAVAVIGLYLAVATTLAAVMLARRDV